MTRNNIMIGQICRDFRMTLGLSQSQVARETGYTRSAVSRFESEGRANYDILMWYIDHGLDLRVATKENRCVCCGELIPEGRQVCPKCEVKL